MAKDEVIVEEKIYGSVADLVASGASEEEFAVIDGFKPGEKVRIGSLDAGDMIEWSEANEGEAKKTAGLRLIAKSLVGPAPENARYAMPAEARNIQEFRKMRHNVTEKIVKAILELNGMRVKDAEKAKKD